MRERFVPIEFEKPAGLRKAIGERYDQLLLERAELSKQLEQYQPQLFDIINFREHVSDEEIQNIVSTWTERARSQTALFDATDSLGIEIFRDDLQNQPNFPREKIVFNSQEIYESNLRDLKSVDGFAQVYEKRVEIVGRQPDLRQQLLSFATTGKLAPPVATLVHELIHRYHQRQGTVVNSVLTETQAYYNGLIGGAPGQDSIVSIAKTLTSQEGGYGFDKDQVINSFITVSGLYGLGKSDKEIADLVSHSVFDYDREKFVPIEEEFEMMSNKVKIDDLDRQALYDLARLHAKNSRQKAQVLLFETLKEKIPEERIKEFKLKQIRETIAEPFYYDKGRKVPARELLQFVSAPVNEEFPYNPNGKRTGVIFGFFQVPGKQKPRFGIGRWEAEGMESRVDLADGPEEQARYLKILKTGAANFNMESKDSLFGTYLATSAHIIEPETRKILQALITPDEAKELYKKGSTQMKKALEIMAHEAKYGEMGNEKLLQYKQIVESLEGMAEIFGLNVNEIDQELGLKLKRARSAIGE